MLDISSLSNCASKVDWWSSIGLSFTTNDISKTVFSALIGGLSGALATLLSRRRHVQVIALVACLATLIVLSLNIFTYSDTVLRIDRSKLPYAVEDSEYVLAANYYHGAGAPCPATNVRWQIRKHGAISAVLGGRLI